MELNTSKQQLMSLTQRFRGCENAMKYDRESSTTPCGIQETIEQVLAVGVHSFQAPRMQESYREQERMIWNFEVKSSLIA
jgi:hypothetical protein